MNLMRYSGHLLSIRERKHAANEHHASVFRADARELESLVASAELEAVDGEAPRSVGEREIRVPKLAGDAQPLEREIRLPAVDVRAGAVGRSQARRRAVLAEGADGPAAAKHGRDPAAPGSELRAERGHGQPIVEV